MATKVTLASMASDYDVKLPDSLSDGATKLLTLDTKAAVRLLNYFIGVEPSSSLVTSQAMLAAASLPTTHTEQVAIGKLILAASGVDYRTPVNAANPKRTNWANGAAWHSNKSRKPRLFTGSNARYSADTPLMHGDGLLHCAVHNTWQRTQCEVACLQGVMQYPNAVSDNRRIATTQGKPSGKWAYETVLGRKSPFGTPKATEKRESASDRAVRMASDANAIIERAGVEVENGNFDSAGDMLASIDMAAIGKGRLSKAAKAVVADLTTAYNDMAAYIESERAQ